MIEKQKAANKFAAFLTGGAYYIRFSLFTRPQPTINYHRKILEASFLFSLRPPAPA